MIVNVHEAKTQLSQLLRRVALGDNVIIARDGVPVARLVPVVAEQATRVSGLGKGTITFASDWDSPETNAQITAMLLGEEKAEYKVAKRKRPAPKKRKAAR